MADRVGGSQAIRSAREQEPVNNHLAKTGRMVSIARIAQCEQAYSHDANEIIRLCVGNKTFQR